MQSIYAQSATGPALSGSRDGVRGASVNTEFSLAPRTQARNSPTLSDLLYTPVYTPGGHAAELDEQITNQLIKTVGQVILQPMLSGRICLHSIDESYQNSYINSNGDATFRRRIDSLWVIPCQARPSALSRPRRHRHLSIRLVRWHFLESESVKINMNEFKESLGGLSCTDPAARLRAVSGLAKYTNAEWQGIPDAVAEAVAALLSACRAGGATAPDGACRAEVAKALGNIGTQSPVVLPELVRLLQKDPDGRVRAEAALALGKIGVGAARASRSIAAVLSDPQGGETLRGAAAWALARVDPSSSGTASALQAAADDRSGHVGVCAAEALWKVSPENGRAIRALAARLGEPGVQQAAAQALYRIGPAAKEAVPALLAAAKAKDRLFRESVLLALQKIDPHAKVKTRLN
jgi:hypothetical protein